MKRFPLVVRQRLRRPIARNQALTLLEMMITILLVSTLLAGLGITLSSHLRLIDAQTSMIHSRRESARLQHILTSESNEACALRGGSDPTSCSQTCQTSATSDLRLLVPVIVNGTTQETRLIRYYLKDTDLRRSGAAIRPDGQLDLSQGSTIDSLVMDSVKAFSATIDSDCHAASISLSLSFPDTTKLLTTSFALRTNVEAVSK